MTCNGPGKSVISHPFLFAPYHGWTSIVSYFDHDSPNFYQDGQIIVANGIQGAPDTAHHEALFPAYWNASIRQFLYYDGHNGYDYNLTYQPIYAAARGRVIFAAWEYPTMQDHGYGQMIMIEHRSGYVTLYGHLSKILVKPGQRVHAGQQIAVSGNTGHSSGPHLHFTVFHNCTPTDPYGWTGEGPDPLSTYKGESSVYLWRVAPLVDNPLPAWPGLDSLPAPSSERIALLTLPSVHAGTKAFADALKLEAAQARAALPARGVSVRIDLIRGALLITGDVTPAAILRLPHVVSITSPGTVEGEREDVLAALARATAYDRARAIQLPGAKSWSANVIRYNGRAILVGKGARGRSLEINLDGRGGGTERVTADPKTGTYAVDLGALSAQQFRRLLRTLRDPHTHTRQVSSPQGAAHAPARKPARASTSSNATMWMSTGAILLAALLAVGLWFARPAIARRRNPS